MSNTVNTLDYLSFEDEALSLRQRMQQLENGEVEAPSGSSVEAELHKLHLQEKRVLRQLYRKLDPWQRTLVARHGRRPHANGFVGALIREFVPLAGDRTFADDPAMVAGIGRFQGIPVAVLGTEKGATTQERMKYNFGMPRPEGYRKAKRIMEMANRFKLPILTFIDTPGAFPGVDAEARGQAEAIASCIETLLSVDVPVISVITGEGGSGGALAIGVADQVLMLENSVFSVISPEGCASILWRDNKAAAQAAEALKLTAKDLLDLKVIDGIIREPVGGAHRDTKLVYERTAKAIENALRKIETGELAADRMARRNRYLAMGNA